MDEIDQLVINSPYEEPGEYWKLGPDGYARVDGRRPAGYVMAPDASRLGDARGAFVEIELANTIRERVGRWRRDGHPGITAVTRELLGHWRRRPEGGGQARHDPLFFCQVEAMETAIWLAEAPGIEKHGVGIPGDGGAFARRCLKMATGTGKTVVMAMLIAWQTLNKVRSPSDPRFSRNFLVVAPGITVKSRLGVLSSPDDEDSYYRRYSIVPDSMREQMRGAAVAIHNWHAFFPKLDEHSVDRRRRTPESPAALARRMLGHCRDNIVVINDEAHHAYRRPEGALAGGREEREADAVANRWMEGLDMIHKARTIRACYDFTATPYIPTGRKAAEEDVFGWIVSDFSLNDAIESGLVKTPRMPPGDGADMSRYYHLFDDKTVKPNLAAGAGEADQLPDLVRQAYMLLARDWVRERRAWRRRTDVPPVMITVCNVTKTSARIKRFFETDPFDFGELKEGDHLVRIDTNMLRIERGGRRAGRDEEALRRKINTVGQRGEPGEQVKNIIAVQMLSEGWDARNVTQIMGLRAFESQLLCEQVVGRGLRRQSYEVDPETGLFSQEFVNILGVPFSFLPHQGGRPPRPEKPRVEVGPAPENADHEITWPNISRIQTIARSDLTVDWDRVEPLRISARRVDMTVDVFPVLDGMPHADTADGAKLDLYEARENLRMQTLIFHVVEKLYSGIESPGWEGGRHAAFAQIAKIVERFVGSGRILIDDMPGDHEDVRRILAVMFNMQSIAGHIKNHIEHDNTEAEKLIFGPGGRSRSTLGVRPYSTPKDVLRGVRKSHISPSPCDSSWERNASRELERNVLVESWVKNERLGFAVEYQYEGSISRYYPDFLVRLSAGKGGQAGGGGMMLVLEIKGRKSRKDDAKHDALARWIRAVNADGRFGTWGRGVSYDEGGADTARIIRESVERLDSAGRQAHGRG